MAAPNASNPLISAILSENTDVALQIVETAPADAQFSEVNSFGLSALHCAAMKGYLRIIQALIDRGANVNQLTKAGTPLQAAVLFKQVDAASTLLDKQADPNLGTEFLPSPLSLAIGCGCSDCFYVLIDAGADLNAQSFGLSPLLLAVAHNENRMVQKLLNSGADCALQDMEGLTALQYAAAFGHSEILDCLMVYLEPIESYPVWTAEALIKHINSTDEMAQIELKLNQKSEYLTSLGDLAFTASNFASAMYWYSEAVICNPRNYEAWANRSSCHYNLKEGRDALIDAETSLSLAPQWPEGYLRKAEACMLLGDYEDAVLAYVQALTLDPGNQLY
ncbi:OLC1v1006916C2 [Oldenlandia corymbosa var. corymbosa]|uniref:OLC1v1006916C2 n=1 Tax=Oldenlandia corymbosa var. corymbosa TaxID=529605 RepID=A0AAV1DKH6_OLDCO|nr:OLC1v1006916C2 [Oldenlandia corymbosa var. corymbosa]